MSQDTLSPEERRLLLIQWLRRYGEPLDHTPADAEVAAALERLREAVARVADPMEKAHLERALKLMDPALRDEYIATLERSPEQ